MRICRHPSSSRLRPWLLALAICGVACGEAAREEPAAPADASAATPPPAPPAEDGAGSAAADAPDLQGALDAAFEHGVVAMDGGNGWQVDPFVAAWVVAAIRGNGDRWLTRYAATGADGVDVKGWQVRVPAGSPLTKLGLADGDVIEKVSGAPSVDLDALKTAVSAADRAVSLTVYRVDVTLTLRYQIVPGMIWDRSRGSLADGEVPPSQVAVVSAPFVPVEESDAVAPPAGAGTPAPPNPASGPNRGGGGGAYGGGVAPTPGASPRPGTRPSDPPKSGGGADKVSCSSASACTVDRAYFRSAVANPSKLQSQATIVPAIANDVHSGYKLKSVKRGSAVHQLGFRSGDKVTHVNGADLTNDLEALALYSTIDSTRKFRVRYIRGGSPRTKTITLR